MQQNDRRLSHVQAAELMCMTPRTLYNWRSQGRGRTFPRTDFGPRYYSYPNGRFWYYLASDVEEYMRAHSMLMTRTVG